MTLFKDDYGKLKNFRFWNAERGMKKQVFSNHDLIIPKSELQTPKSINSQPC